MAKLTDQEWGELQAKYAGKRLARVDLKTIGSFVFRAPTRAEFSIFQAQRLDDTQRTRAYDDLALRTVVYPEAESLMTMSNEYPGLFVNNAIVKALNTLNGIGLEEEGKG